MKVKDLKLTDLVPYEQNPRVNDEAVDYVAKSIEQFGFKQPIVVDNSNVIICGHTRFKAAAKLNLEKVPCVVADDLTEEQIKAYRLADNKVSEFSTWDENVLGLELGEIESLDMSDFGFEPLVDMDEFGEEFELPDGDKSEICQMSFVLHQEQKALIEYAMGIVKDSITETFGNTNRNGNALYEVVRQWAEQRK